MLVIREERKSSLVKLSGCCLCLGFLSLLIASSLPMFVVSTFKGEAKVLIADIKVDFAIGKGLWRKNVCFGSYPSEDFLKQVGLSCEGSSQTENCENVNDLTDEQKSHCDDYLLMQGLEIVSLFSIFLASLIGSCATCCSRSTLFRTLFRFGAIFNVFIAISTASSVLKILKESDMVNERLFGCTNVFGADLCHSYGASYGLQYLGITQLAIAFCINILLLCIGYQDSTTYQVVSVPLLEERVTASRPYNVTPGVIIHPPPTKTAVPSAIL